MFGVSGKQGMFGVRIKQRLFGVSSKQRLLGLAVSKSSLVVCRHLAKGQSKQELKYIFRSSAVHLELALGPYSELIVLSFSQVVTCGG